MVSIHFTKRPPSRVDFSIFKLRTHIDFSENSFPSRYWYSRIASLEIEGGETRIDRNRSVRTIWKRNERTLSGTVTVFDRPRERCYEHFNLTPPAGLQIYSIRFQGSDTSAIAECFCVLLLAMHQDIQVILCWAEGFSIRFSSLLQRTDACLDGFSGQSLRRDLQRVGR